MNKPDVPCDRTDFICMTLEPSDFLYLSNSNQFWWLQRQTLNSGRCQTIAELFPYVLCPKLHDYQLNSSLFVKSRLHLTDKLRDEKEKKSWVLLICGIWTRSAKTFITKVWICLKVVENERPANDKANGTKSSTSISHFSIVGLQHSIDFSRWHQSKT